MTPEQINSMEHALAEFTSKAEAKYREGQAEHQGNLWEKDGLLEEAGKEVTDLVFYLAAHRERVSHVAFKVRSLVDFIDSRHPAVDLASFKSSLLSHLTGIHRDLVNM